MVNKILCLQMPTRGYPPVPQTTAPVWPFVAFFCPLVAKGGQCFSLSDSQTLLCACPPSYYIMNFDKPISQPGSQEEDVFLT